jgi:aldose 1-epimerase
MSSQTQISNYSAQRIVVDSLEVVRLGDAGCRTELFIAPAMGNMAYDMRVNGQQLLWSPYETVAEWLAKPVQLGIPFLGPWANRLDQDAFFANGKKYCLNPEVIGLDRDPNGLPIHGLLLFAKDWQVIRMQSDASAAEVTSRLEFWKHPDWMAQFPFAHTVDMTHRLADGVLEVRLSIDNHSVDPMPLSVGFHPWYRIADCPRDEWRLHLPVRTRYPLSEKLIPTGVTEPCGLPDSFTLAEHRVNDVFGGVNSPDEFTLEGKSQKISVRFGAKYPIAIVFAPHTIPAVCFEPMSGVTNAFNLAHAGVYQGLQTIAPGEKWSESFWLTPSGY